MNKPTIPEPQKRRLQAHYGFSGVPFRKNVLANRMFDSSAQRELGHALRMWTEIRGLALVTGPVGVGKSITLRRFAGELDEARFRVVRISQGPTTAYGCLRSLARHLAFPMNRHAADLFDAIRDHLAGYAEAHGPHPLILLDDAEGLHTDDLLRTLQAPSLEPLRSRIAYAAQLRPFSLEDARNYVKFHLTGAGVAKDLLTEPAARILFQVSHGRPRAINQLALQALIQGAVEGRDKIDGRFMEAVLAAHPLLQGGPR